MTFIPVQLKGKVIGGKWPSFFYDTPYKVSKDGVVGEALLGDKDSALAFIDILSGDLPAREKKLVSELVLAFPGGTLSELA